MRRKGEATEGYKLMSEEVKQATLDLFWDDEKGGLLHHRVNGETMPFISKHASMFALTYQYLTSEQRDSVIERVLLNPEVPAIRTPYMRFHELAVLCESGKHEVVLQEMLSYWGGMIDLGATTFWEEYDPTISGDKHYEMYGMPFGKSLCHAWGASPIYVIGKYFLGVKPISNGYKSFVVEPELGGLEWFKGSVPLPEGSVDVEMDEREIRVRTSYGQGVLRYEAEGKLVEAAIPSDGSWLVVERKR